MMIPVHIHLRQDQIKLLDDRVQLSSAGGTTRASLIRQAVDQMLQNKPQQEKRRG